MGCTPCLLTVAMSKAVKLSTKSDVIIDGAVELFVEGHKTFRETCMELGISEEHMGEILDKEYWNETMK